MQHMMPPITNKHKKQLFAKINSLCKTEHEEIYKIIRKYNHDNQSNPIAFSQNRNGIFFNLSDIEDALYLELDKFVDFCITNKKDLDDYDKKINECKINNNYNSIQNNSEAKQVDEEQDKPEDWNAIISDPRSVQRVSSYIERLVNDRDKSSKKKINVKFNNAKKKFSKKIVNEKKIDGDNIQSLNQEHYLISAPPSI